MVRAPRIFPIVVGPIIVSVPIIILLIIWIVVKSPILVVVLIWPKIVCLKTGGVLGVVAPNRILTPKIKIVIPIFVIPIITIVGVGIKFINVVIIIIVVKVIILIGIPA